MINSVLQKYLDGDEQDKLSMLEEALKHIYGRGGCACIKDMPGDNYTCYAHYLLWVVGRHANA